MARLPHPPRDDGGGKHTAIQILTVRATRAAPDKLAYLASEIEWYGTRVARSNRVFGAMVERMALVSPAPGDEAPVAQWIGGLRRFTALQAQSAPAWKHHELGRALDLSTSSIDALNAGGAAVKDFGISACPVSVEAPGTT